MGKVLSLAHSPDADDLVMWWPLVGGRDRAGCAIEGVPTEPIVRCDVAAFRTIAEDVQALNAMALWWAGASASDGLSPRRFDISAISAATYPRVARVFRITRCGASFGEGYGPKLVVRADAAGGLERALHGGARIAVPGLDTTAVLVLSMVLHERGIALKPGMFEPMRFDRVIEAVSSGACGAGLLIHEAQLTFAQHGLGAVLDLGLWWQERTGLPLPLGLNVMRRDLDATLGSAGVARVADALAGSVRACVQRASASRAFLRAHGQDRPEWSDDALLDRYLAMYVSPLTVDMGERGREALRALFERSSSLGLAPAVDRLDVL